MLSWKAAALILFALFKICGSEEVSNAALKFVANLVDDVCQDRDDCVDGVLNDLIFLISGDPYDPSDRDSGSSRMTVLLEVIDDKCELDKICSGKLFADMRDRIINERAEFNGENNDGFLSLDSAETAYSDDNNDDSDETQFERFERKDHLDETVMNTIFKDECQQNRAACSEYVAKQKKLGLNHIGKIRFDEDGEPVAEVPDSVFFEAELNVSDGSDDPE